MKIFFLFPGQGSHYYHMGSKLMDLDAGFRKTMLELDDICRTIQGSGIIERLYDPRCKISDPFTSLQVTHPAIFMVEYSLASMLMARGLMPDGLLGFSLGEFTAAALSGVLSCRDVLGMIIGQAAAIEGACKPGGLVAVLDSPAVYDGHPELSANCTLASVNGPSQFVVAGASEGLAIAKQFMKSRDILHQELMVSYGFHSSAIDPAAIACKALFARYRFHSPAIPMVSGLLGRHIEDISTSYFWDTVRQPMEYKQAIAALTDPFDAAEERIFIDAGPSGSLANIVKYHLAPQSLFRVFQVMSPFQQEPRKLEELLQYCPPVRRAPIPPAAVRKEQLLAYVFPGQGSQRKGMGEGLFERYPELTDKASSLLGYSIQELCVANPGGQLNKTQFTQPALFVVSALAYLQLTEDSGTVPDFVAGHSLGEYNALFAAGAMDFATGVLLVQKRGALMAKMAEGGMAAVKGLSLSTIERIIQDNGLDALDIANQNSCNQIVLSGPKQLIDRSANYFTDAGASLYFPLNVSGAFHSRYMQSAKEEYEVFLRQFRFSPLKIPVVSNVEATPYTDDRMLTLLAEQLVRPVRWLDSVSYLLQQGAEVAIREVGPGDVLTKLVYGIRRDMGELVQ